MRATAKQNGSYDAVIYIYNNPKATEGEVMLNLRLQCAYTKKRVDYMEGVSEAINRHGRIETRRAVYGENYDQILMKYYGKHYCC